MKKKQMEVLGVDMPYINKDYLNGKLIVIEGTDGVGRSTQIYRMKNWLESQGYGVTTTGWTRSDLMSDSIERAKSGHNLNLHTFTLLYLADFADRMEHEILPALKSGFIVLADRYIYTLIARTMVRGINEEWIKKILGFALKPDTVIYLKIGIEDLIPRVINPQMILTRYREPGSGEGIDYWESGMDVGFGEDVYDSFVTYQKKIIREYGKMAKENGFITIDASMEQNEIENELKKHIEAVLDDE